jgi:hypothetical protein
MSIKKNIDRLVFTGIYSTVVEIQRLVGVGSIIRANPIIPPVLCTALRTVHTATTKQDL